jgi:hypothetical protein
MLPIFSVAIAGYLLGSKSDVDVKALNTITIYVLIPSLIFHSIVTTSIAWTTMGKVLGGVVVYTALMGGLTKGVGRVLGVSTLETSALVLVSVFTNVGNYGIPLAEFAFGLVGRATAVLFLVAQNVMMYTVGVYVASRGDERAIRDAVETIFRLPLVYAVVAGGAVRLFNVVPAADGTFMRTIGLTGEAAIPIMLLILGIELARMDPQRAFTHAGTATALKLLVAPLVGLVVMFLLGFENPVVARVFVLACATPTALTPLMLTIEFTDVPLSSELTVPEYVSAVIFATSIVGVVLLTGLIVLLQTGVVV